MNKEISLYTQKEIIFIKTLHKMLKLDLMFQTMNQIDHCLKEKLEVIGLMKEGLGGKILTKSLRLRAKTYSYLIDHSGEDKKAKGTKKCAIKRKFKSENYKNRLGATQLYKKIKC